MWLALFLELAFDRVVLLGPIGAGGRAGGLTLGLTVRRRRGASGLVGLVHRLADLRRGLPQRVGRGLDLLGVVGLERIANGRDLLLDIGLHVRGHLVAR